jgi:putative tricarboxylic transport membrane protein
MVEILVSALTGLLQVQHLFYMFIGVSLGLVIGVIPGLGGIAGLSLLMPFLYGMDQVSAMAMLIGLVAVIPTSDTFASVLIGIPGSSASQATVIDGFPLARKGEGARALSAAFISSLFGGVFGAIVLSVFIVIARPLILSFGSPELFMLSVFGLSMVAALSGRSLAKGIVACALGLLLGGVGGAPSTGEFRLTFGVSYLYDGVPLVVVALGLFAVPEISDLLRRNGAIAEQAVLGSGWSTGLRDWWRNKFLSLRCAAIGCLVGAIPGLGGSVVDWIAYSHAVQSCRKDPHFGTGDIRGVIAPESANNAMQGGALLPTLLFGIPGSGAMAVFLVGMTLIGISPGPSMVTTGLETTYSLVWSLALANIMGAGICILLAGPISRLTGIPFPKLAPIMIVLICFAAFQATRDMGDLIALVVLGAVGVLMRRYGWSRPALLIGFVLSMQSETYFYQALQFNGWKFLLDPGAMVIGLMAIGSVLLGLRNRIDEKGAVTQNTVTTGASPAGRWARKGQIGFALAAAVCLVIGLADGLKQSFTGGIFPTSVTIAGLCALAFLLKDLVFGGDGHGSHYDSEETESDQGALWGGMIWIAGLVLGSALIGFYLAMVVFMPLFLRLRARCGWATTAILSLCAALAVAGLARMLGLNFPMGWLQYHSNLPWPLR